MKKTIALILLLYNTYNIYALNIPIYGSLFIYGKDTLSTLRNFISTPYVGAEIIITSDDMCFQSCFSQCYSPTWLIENDSIFLISLLNDDNDRTAINIQDLFKERCINGRVFAKEITYKLTTHRYIESSTDYDTDICFTIKNGIVIDHGECKNNSEYANWGSSEINIETNTDWKNLPEIAVDRLVTIKIKTNEKGELVSASVVKNRNNLKPEGEDVWKQEALRQVKLVSKWDIQYECGQFVNNEREIEFLFSKQK